MEHGTALFLDVFSRQICEHERFYQDLVAVRVRAGIGGNCAVHGMKRGDGCIIKAY